MLAFNGNQIKENLLSYKRFNTVENKVFLNANEIGVLIIFGGNVVWKNEINKEEMVHLSPYTAVIFNTSCIPKIMTKDNKMDGVVFKLNVRFLQNILTLIKFESSVKSLESTNCMTLPKRNDLELLYNSFELYLKRPSFLPIIFESMLLELIWLSYFHNKLNFERFMYPFMIPDRVLLDSIINKHFRENLSLEQFASLAGFSVSTFKRKFVAAYKCSPHKWIQSKRLSEAKSLLKYSGKSISEIGFEVGFENISHFIQAFRQKFGTTPKALQNELKSARIAS